MIKSFAVTSDECFKALCELADDAARFRREADQIDDLNLRLFHEQLADQVQRVLEAILERPGLPDTAPWWPDFRHRLRFGDR